MSGLEKFTAIIIIKLVVKLRGIIRSLVWAFILKFILGDLIIDLYNIHLTYLQCFLPLFIIRSVLLDPLFEVYTYESVKGNS